MPIHHDLADQVSVITIDRPERRNALNLAALNDLDAVVRQAIRGRARALVLTGTAGHFCAGADLTELEDVRFTERLSEVLRHLAAAPLTTVAAISGSCMGLGMQLALASDLRVATDDARFAVPVAKLGLMVDAWTLERLCRFWGEGAARQMVLTADVLTTEDAWRLGFVQHRGGLDVALELARRSAALAPLSQSGSKVGFDAQGDRTAYEEAFQRAWASEDLAEGQRAFRERREARFRGV